MELASTPHSNNKSIVACSHCSVEGIVRQQEIVDTPGLSRPVLFSSLKLSWGPLHRQMLSVTLNTHSSAAVSS